MAPVLSIEVSDFSRNRAIFWTNAEKVSSRSSMGCALNGSKLSVEGGEAGIRVAFADLRKYQKETFHDE